MVLPVNVDPGDDYFLELFCQSVGREPVRLDEATIAKRRRDSGLCARSVV